MSAPVVESTGSTTPLLAEALTRHGSLADERGPVTWSEGAARALHPDTTVARVTPLLPVLGITRVADVTGLDRVGIPVFVAVRPNSRALSTAQGKGVTRAAARASAVMECIESWHAERLDAPLRYASFDDLRWQHRVVDVQRLPLVEDSVFTPLHRMLWVEGVVLGRAETALVPHELVHTDYTLPKPTGAGAFLPSSNGLASGNTAREAVVHALCEVVERDATTLWQLLPADRRDRTRVDLSTVHDPVCRTLLEAFTRAAVDVAVWDITSDTGVPAFLCVAVERDDDVLHRLHSAAGMGCHPRPEVALSRALTEAAQSRVTVITGSREDVLREDYAQTRDPDVLARDRTAVSGSGVRDFGAIRPLGDLGEATRGDDELTVLLDALRGIGCDEVVAVPLTRREIGVPVVRIVVPGLESASSLPGWVPGPRASAARTPR